jgi:hypothetical protein
MRFTPSFESPPQHAAALLGVGRLAPESLAGDPHGSEAHPVDDATISQREDTGSGGGFGLRCWSGTPLRYAHRAQSMACEPLRMSLEYAMPLSLTVRDCVS